MQTMIIPQENINNGKREAVTLEFQPAIFTLYAWHKLEDSRRDLRMHLVAAHNSEKAERFVREHQPALMDGADCFISTDYLLNHLNSFGACLRNYNSIAKGYPLGEYEFMHWVREMTVDRHDDGEISFAPVRAIK